MLNCLDLREKFGDIAIVLQGWPRLYSPRGEGDVAGVLNGDQEMPAGQAGFAPNIPIPNLTAGQKYSITGQCVGFNGMGVMSAPPLFLIICRF
jgi:hypothetical protein